MENKTKKIVAKEILIFFGTLLLSLLFLAGLMLYKQYLIRDTEKKSKLITELESEKKSLPSNRVNALYENGLKNELFYYYKLGMDTVAVSKKHQEEFLVDEYGIAKNVRQLENHKEYFSWFPSTTINLEGKKITYKNYLELSNQVKQIYPTYKNIEANALVDKIKAKFVSKKDSSLVFDYVNYEEFRVLLENKRYRNNLYQFMNKEFDMGTLAEYEKKIAEGLEYDENVIKRSKSIETQLTKIKQELKNRKSSLMDKSETFRMTFITWLVLIGIAYPMRWTFKILKWSVNTVQK
ncbi:hypothetical protein Q4599_02005 [Cellulophaga lytica]|uniref:hypothetical protein n=1 Tax=Cellulophaga TaxID=104264 RepID=UPI00051D916F|nr:MULTISPECIES: hypothetical protein [Cellulophaga]KGK29579.1 hypothetical protein EL45_13350 [Cellulophaga sp. E6(2014)]MDO6852336.1 hypothetical protein [Cellulophaga lytica]